MQLCYETSIAQSTHLDGKVVNWNERRLIVRSLKAARTEERARRERLQKAQVAISQLGERRRGKKLLRTIEDWHSATANIMKRYRVQGLLQLNYQLSTETRPKRRYGNRPAQLEETREISLDVNIDETAVREAINLAGWLLYATNCRPNAVSLDCCCGCL